MGGSGLSQKDPSWTPAPAQPHFCSETFHMCCIKSIPCVQPSALNTPCVQPQVHVTCAALKTCVQTWGHMYNLEYAMYAALGTYVQPCGYFTCATSSFFPVSPSQCVRPVLLLSDSDTRQCSGGWRGLMGMAGHARGPTICLPWASRSVSLSWLCSEASSQSCSFLWGNYSQSPHCNWIFLSPTFYVGSDNRWAQRA